MPVTRPATLLAAAIATGACFAYRPATLTPEPGSRVRVVLTTATAVPVSASARGDGRLVYPGVLEASGTIQGVAGDTIALRLGELRTAAGPIPAVADHVAMLPTARIARIEQRRFQAGTTLLAGGGALALAATAYIILLIAAITRGF
jgi:hypothetical protein